MRPQPPRRARADPATVVPVLQRLRRRGDRRDRRRRVDQRVVLACRRPARSRCSRISRSRRSRANTRAPSPRPAGSRGSRSSRVSSRTAHDSSLSCVHDRRLKLSLPTHAPDVVDDADLGVHVDRCARVVFDVEDVHPVRARPDGRSRSPAGGRPGWAAARTGRPRPGAAAPPRSGAGRGSLVSASANRSATWLDHRYWSSR